MKSRRLTSFIIIAFITLSTIAVSVNLSTGAPTWSSNVRLTNHLGPDYINILGGALALDSEGHIHVVSYYAGQIYHIYDNNSYINETVIAQAQSAGQGYDAAPTIFIDENDTIHVAYYSSDGNDYEIYYTHSTPTGGFITPVKVTDNTAADGFPKIVVDSEGVVHISYQLSEYVDIGGKDKPIRIVLRYVHSETGGGFTSPINITYPLLPDMSVGHDMVVDKNDNVHIAFMAFNGYNPLYNASDIVYTNESSSFSSFQIIDKTYQDFNPSIAVDDNLTVHLVFKGNGSIYDGNIHYQYLYYGNNSGGSFNASTISKITDISFSHSPRIAVSPNGTLNIAFYGWDKTWPQNYSRVMYMSGLNGSFSQKTFIPPQDQDQYLPSLAIGADNQVHIVYMNGDSSPGATSNIDLYYVTTSEYYPVGVPEPESQEMLFLVIGVAAAVNGVAVFAALFFKFRRLEKEVWKPKFGEDEDREPYETDT